MIDVLNKGVRRIHAWPLYIVGVIPAVWLIYSGATGGLGAEPIKALEHRLGLIGLQLLIAGLAITPLRKWAGLNLIKFRRAIGLLTFFYILLHLLVWLVLDVQILSQIWADIIKRPYITIGMIGFILMIPLAVTSNNYSIRKLGAKWRRLHQLTYVAAVLGAIHFVMLSKGFQLEPFAYLIAILTLLATRIRWNRKRVVA
ncbi:protein-methionine-sulfoxide reductase heme-binding subunit MsrQ [Parasulfitobacter algicola]|uniref:Protein-methionine-sulfoxide reductase heme-binding subunit MsrQ n=1 Tax=Parasulfitobacter algicola TaxID=2614809 RepID=A0ABX2IKY3_9RHOB|nr:protein-methionine-sulfoxide reductase heme-binding subunit MsrQ [Sulfitobacter algicola]NSX53508.1 protein-methionine-sulfoxide reductase heme-binding subunit MsrQ [Sulfitobacter algicola]